MHLELNFSPSGINREMMWVSVDQHFTRSDYVIFAAVFCTDHNMQNKLYYENRTKGNKLFIFAALTAGTRHKSKKRNRMTQQTRWLL